MKVLVTRTSVYSDRKPCEEAIKDDNAMYLSGVKQPYSMWYIEIETLEDMLEFVKKYGEIVFGVGILYKGYDAEIEIYDTYRE